MQFYIANLKLVSLSFFLKDRKLDGSNSSESTNKHKQSSLLDGNYSISIKIILAPLNLDKHSQS